MNIYECDTLIGVGIISLNEMLHSSAAAEHTLPIAHANCNGVCGPKE
jgi:hypothetical protein